MLIEKEELKPYERITDAQRKIREGGDFIDEVLDRFLNGTHMTGIKLPFPPVRLCVQTQGAGNNGIGWHKWGGKIIIRLSDHVKFDQSGSFLSLNQPGNERCGTGG